MKTNLLRSVQKRHLIQAVFLLCFSIGFSQVSVSGTITDSATSEVLPGANIIIKGSTNGTQTDFDGNFSIEVQEGDVLVISYLGFVTKEVSLEGNVKLQVQLTASSNTLDDVIVVGYGTRSKRKIISSVSVVEAETLKSIPVPNVSNALEGLASGLFVRQGSGEPGFSGSSFEVRNFGNALVIVDGSPGDLNQLDPNEIESISVLKDAAAASIYGVQGGNGVVLVTTRRGTYGKPKLTYTNAFTYTSFTSSPNYLSSAQHAEVANEEARNSGNAPSYSAEQIEKYRSGSDPLNYPNTDWEGLVLKDWGFQQRHNLSLSGGSDKVKYFVNAGYLSQGSNYTEDVLSYEQFNLRSNLEADIYDNLQLTFNIAARRRLNEAPAYSAYDVFREISRSLPTDLAYYPDGTPKRPVFSPNHIKEGMRDFNAGYYKNRNNNIDAKISLKWDIDQVEGLSVKGYASVIYDTYFRKEWGKGYELYNLNRQTGAYDGTTASPEGAFSETILTATTAYSNQYVVRGSINYDRVFGDHSVTGLFLTEVQKNQGEDFWGRRQDFQSTAIDQLYAGAIKLQGANGGEYRESRLGFVGRISYDYQSKYFVESSYRYDGSSKFAPGNEWGFFPSVSLGWRMSEETFFKPLKKTITNLKFRGSVGTAGYDGESAFEWLNGFVFNEFYAINDGAIPTINNKVLANQDITWETLTTYDVGVDMDLFENDLSLSFDYFYRKKDDVIASASSSVPSTLGVQLANQNLHEYSNEGFEISANYKKQFNQDWKFNAGLNFSKAREKAVFIDEAPITDSFMASNLTQTGNYTNLRRGYISDGLFQTQEQIDASPLQDTNGNATIKTGDIKYQDLNGDDVIDVKDQKVFGDGDKATINYSLNLVAQYKNWSLSALLTGAAGYDLYLDGEAQSPLRNGFNGYEYQLDYWTPENTSAAFPRITEGGTGTGNNYKYSDYWLRDGMHLRVKNINLSYSFPKALIGGTLDELKLYFTGYNLFVIKNYNEAFDPQMDSSQGFYYPQTKSLTFGVNVSL
tara:strand:- start:9504 stop:12581 length:3078 start_codon:yes stop_codon:yes gene_type:complete